ncbi:MAG: protein phosphatase 2C domain-containing protein [Firmicutes bacterium]|nr:protein phosphatase 2C domain-containing protein [Bacillota bacterium]
MSTYSELKWLGNDEMHLDEIDIKKCGSIYIGSYGGNTEAGADKNEDGAFVLSDSDWKFAMILDAHTSSESAKLVLNYMVKYKEELLSVLNLPIETMFAKVKNLILDIFLSKEFVQKSKKVKGETACLICIQREQYVWWLSIGDNLVYLLHPEFAELGQYKLNQRQFYQWVGQVNSLNLTVPCYSTGIRELREGWNYIYLITDGVLECGERPFENSKLIYDVLTKSEDNGKVNIKSNIFNLLNRVNEEKGRDSATTIGWAYYNKNKACRPSR